MSSEEEREIEILLAKLKFREARIKKYETDKERYMTELCGKIDALIDILMALGYTESQARPLHNTILARGVILDAIKRLQARVPKPKHTDKRSPDGPQYLSLDNQKEMKFNG